MVRRLLFVAFFLIVGGPLVLPFFESFYHFNFRSMEWDRQAILAARTLSLLGLIVALTVPPAIAFALLLGSTNLPGRQLFLFVVVLSLSIPLPIVTISWQGVSWAGWRPFDAGLLPAAVIHTLAGLPWVVLILLASLIHGDPAIVDDVLINASGWSRIIHGIWPRLRLGVVLALIWLLASAGGEIVVTDLMQVRTYAEEVYTQFVSPATDQDVSAETATARAIIAAMPWIVGSMIAVSLVFRRVRIVPLHEFGKVRPWLQLRARFAWAMALAVSVGLLTLTPFCFLVWRAGIAPPAAWSASQLQGNAILAVRDSGAILVWTLIWSLLVGLLLVFVTALLCWECRYSRFWRLTTALLAVLALVMPSPIIGLGIKACIGLLMHGEQRLGIHLFQPILYDGPSYVPVAWAWTIRAFPLAVAVLWPVFRDWPSALIETTRMDSASPWVLVRHAIWPMCRRSLGVAVLLVGILCFGEVSVSRLPATPGATTFAHELFERMHFGLRPDLAACAVLGIVAVGIGLGVLAMTEHALKSIHRQQSTDEAADPSFQGIGKQTPG